MSRRVRPFKQLEMDFEWVEINFLVVVRRCCPATKVFVKMRGEEVDEVDLFLVVS